MRAVLAPVQGKQKGISPNGGYALDIIGRDDWIRTSGPLNPIQVRYQTALRPDILKFLLRRTLRPLR